MGILAKFKKRRSGRWLSTAFWALVLLVIVGLITYRQGAVQSVGIYGGDTISGRAEVVTGDTLEIRGQRIRLWGIHAPREAQTCTRGGQSWECGRQAADALEAFLAGRSVTCTKKGRDRQERIVAVCEVGDEDLGTWLVRNGWALSYARHTDGAYAGAQRKAEAAGRGLWQGEFDPPWEWRRR
jgi:endonuclease YncB( thermonuclease family)